MEALLIPLSVAGLAALLLLADIAPAKGDARGIGSFAALGLFGILALTWVVAPGADPSGSYVSDAFTVFVQRLVLLAGALACVASIDHADAHFPKRQGEFYLLLVASVFGMTLIAGARELVLLLVGFETMGIPQYVLAAMHKDKKTGVEGATKLYLTGALSAGLTIYGASFLVGASGTTFLPQIATTPHSAMLGFGALLVLAGVAFKLGAVPFHMWIPDAYASAPAPFVAFLSVAPKVAVLATVARISWASGEGMFSWWTGDLLVLAALTLTVGNLFALPQRNVRRLLAWSGIGHAGLVLLALGLATTDGIGAALFYLTTYVVSNIGAFVVAEAVGGKVGDEVEGWNGLARRSPGLALAMLLFLLSLGGIPFVAGFWGKVLLFRTAWAAGQSAMVFYGALLSVVSLFYYLKIARAMYVEPPKDAAPIAVGRATILAIVLALIGVIGLGMFPSPFWDSAVEAGGALLVTGPVALVTP